MWLPAYLYGGFLLFTSIMILLERNGRKWAATLGVVFIVDISFLFILHTRTFRLRQLLYHRPMANEFKALASSGGAFVVAYSFRGKTIEDTNFRWMEFFIPYGNLFFSLSWHPLEFVTLYMLNTYRIWSLSGCLPGSSGYILPESL
jgi:hypothetical protein